MSGFLPIIIVIAVFGIIIKMVSNDRGSDYYNNESLKREHKYQENYLNINPLKKSQQQMQRLHQQQILMEENRRFMEESDRQMNDFMDQQDQQNHIR
ncbi:hypothetical protein [Evansella tamaricis]|uniref:Uncharacterized protein n=1 Tax=Evansella tamaricis TaxID=2069301 RepID=A0ABS6J9G7_9BACI|nr:hypothetical protein [Evansella tamaricis]MBU9710331.1 hypothetical protein [Evansella tamaricis]